MTDWHESYAYTLADLGSSLSCPQCRAVELLRAIIGQDNPTAMGQRVACREILRKDHECGKPTRRYRLASEGG